MAVFKATPYKKKEGENESSNKSVFKATKYKTDSSNKTSEAVSTHAGWQKYLEDEETRQNEALYGKEDEKWWEKLGRWLGNGGAVDTTLPTAGVTQTIHDLRVDTSHRRPQDNWSEIQKKEFADLYLSSPEAAYEYAEETNKINNAAKEEAQLKEIQDSATDNGWSATGHTAGAIVTAPLGLADFLQDLAYANAGREIAPDGNISPFEYSQAVTGGISANLNENYGVIDESVPIFGGKGWGDAYGLGVSIAQSAASAYTLGGGGTLVSYFGQGAASGVDDALSRGATDTQAVLYGTALGAFEGIAEQIGVDNLFKLSSSSLKKELFKNVLKQAGAEGIEEGLTSVLGNIADNVIMQDKSNFNAMVKAYMEQGMTEDEAKTKAWMDSVAGIAYDTIGGFVSGGVHAGAHTIGNTAINSVRHKNMYGADTQALVSEALEISPDNAYAQKMKSKLDKGKNLTGYNILQLVESNENALVENDKAKIKAIAEETLIKYGESGDVSKIAEVIAKIRSGEKITKDERKILMDSTFGRRVSTELNPDIIEAGGHTTDWTGSIGTERISSEVYNRAIATESDTAVPQDEASSLRIERNNFGVYDKPLHELDQAMSGMRNVLENVSVARTIAASETATGTAVKTSDSGKTTYTDAKGNTKEVTIKGIASTKGGLKLELEGGITVNASDLDFGSKEEALMYEMVARMEVTPETANEIISTFKPSNIQQATMFFSTVPLAYQYGTMNYEAGLKNIALPENLKRIAYNRGRMDAVVQDKAKIKATSKKRSNKATNTTTKKNGIIFEDGVHYDESTANELQRASMIGIETIAQMSSLEVHVFESVVEDGDRVFYLNGERQLAPNGYFKDGNKIYIDLNAGSGGEGAMLYTMSHEVTHYIREWNAKGFRELGDFLIAEYGKKGVPVNALIEKQKDKIRKRHEREKKALPSDAKLADMAYEELVADAMSDMFTDPKAYEKLAKLKQQNKTLWQKLGEAIKALLDKLKSALGIYKTADVPVAREAFEVRGFSADVYEKLQALYIKAFVEADANYEALGEKHLNNRDIAYNLRATESHKKKLGEQYSKDASIDLETLTQRYNKIIDIWESLGGELNSKFLNEWNNKVGKDRAFTVFKAQAGYKYNVELSSMCKKGVPLFEAIDTIVKEEVMKQLDTKVLGKAEKEILYDLLKSHNFEIPCAICYVEQARQREGAIIDSFLNGKIEKNKSGKITQFKLGWNEVLQAVQEEMKANGVDYTFGKVDRSIATDKYAPVDTTMDATTQEAFYKALKKIANKEITRYNKAENKNRKLVTNVTPSAIKEVFKGTLPSNLKIFKVLFTDPSSRFMLESDLLYSSMTTTNLATAHNELYSLFNSQGGVSGYKTKQGTVVYWGDILGKSWKPSTVRDEGGIRNQSNSDFQMYTLLDQVQMYIDFTAKGYYLQAYTKVLSELKLFGLSRGKINASLIPAVYEYRNADGSIDIETTRANAGLDKNGNLLFDDIEGINHNEAFMLLEDAEYSKSIGGICIGYSDAHILKLLDDKRVQQIIGFHDKTDDPDKRYRGARYAKNYNGLNEAVKIDNDGNPKTIHIGFNPYVRKAEKKFTFNSKTEMYEGTVVFNGKTYVADDIPKLAADMYLDMCAEKGYAPAYEDFAFHENYYKLLADFSLYDSQGHYAPHRKVAYNMPDTVPYLDINGKKQYMPTKDYIKAELEKELKVRDSISEALADKSENGLIPQFVKKVNELHQEQSETKLSDRDSESKDKQDKIIADMSEEERYEVLKNKKITAPFYEGEADAFIAEELEGKTNRFAKQAIVTIANKLGVIGSEINFKDVEVKIVLSNSNLRESLSKRATPEQIAKLLPVLSTTAENSVVIERHDNRYYYDTDTVYFDNLLGAYIDGDYLIPVRFGLKHSKMETTTLYVVVDQNKVALENLEKEKNDRGHQDASPTKEESNNLRRSVAYSISQIIPFVNSKDLLRYIPDGMLLNENQRTAKWEAIAETITKTNEKNDKKYAEYIEKGNLIAAKQMVLAAAKANGYNSPIVSHGTRAKPFTVFKPTATGVYLATNREVAEDFATGWKGEKGTVYDLLVNVEKPLIVDEHIYSSVPYYWNIPTPTVMKKNGFTEETVSTEEIAHFAKDHGYDGVIVRGIREGTGVFTDDYIVFEANQLKSADPITYDDNGNVIPLSERFNTENNDIRYSDRDSYAPTFYSHMGKVIDGIKLEKMGANGVVSYLKGKGVKDEEIKWSGIEIFLEGKKSVTKAELQEFVAGSQLQIEETYITADSLNRFSDYMYDIIGERIEDWYDDLNNISYRDFAETLGVYLSEGDISEDEGNDLLEKFEQFASEDKPRWSQYKLDGGTNYRELVFKMPNSTYSNRAMRGHWGQDAEGVLVHARIQDFNINEKKMLFIEELQSDWHNEGLQKGYSTKEYEDAVQTHDALYDKYKKLDLAFHKYVRSNDFMTDPEDVRKKKSEWLRGKVETAQKKYLEAEKVVNALKEKGAGDTADAPFRSTYHEYVLKRLLRMAAEEGYDSIGWTIADTQSKRWSYDYEKAYQIEYDQEMPKFLRKYGKKWGATVGKETINDTQIWSMDITDSMKDSVLNEGQVLYSDREIQPITEAEYTALKNHFGVTGNFRVAGYLLPDGKLLDFSGKHWGDTTSRSRQVDHRDAGEVLNRGNNGINDMIDMIGSGSIRLMPETGGINLAVYPNEKQRRVLSSYINYMLATEGQVIIDYDAVGGDTVYSRIYEKGATSSRILGDIRNYFNGARQSELMSFHTQYSERDPDAVSNRTLLANALEGVAQNDIEKNKLAQYKEKIALIESEQKKLAEIRAKANELRFTKGRTPADTKTMRDLDAEANQIANRISTWDKQLLNLESTTALKNVLEREKAMLRKKLEQKSKQALKDQRQKDAATTRELLTRYQESRKQAIEGRHKTEIRHKIKNVVSDLNKLLLNPTKDQHVPIGLQLPVAEALDAINMDTMNAGERVAYYNDLIAKSNDPDEIAMLTKKRDFFEYRDANFKERITALKNAYAEFKESDDPLIRNAHNDAIEDLIKNTADAVGNKSLKDMSMAQLEAVYNMYKAILATVRNSNKMFKEGRQETVTDNSEAVKTEVKEVGGHKDRVLKVTKSLKKFGWNMLKPITAMKVIGSKTFEKLFDNVRAAEDTWAVDVNEAKRFYDGASDKYGFNKWDFKKRYSFKDSAGTDFSLSLEQIMSLYAYSKREQADKHLEFGGFIFDDAIEVTEKGKLGIPLKYEVNDANPYRLRKEDLLAITDSLTKEQKAFIDEMQTYLSDVMGEKGNEVSLAMYDIKLYNEKNYFPLKTSRYFREFDPEKSGTPKIKNSGFSKKTVPQAGNPIVLSNFMDVWASHVNDMSMYHAFVLPLEDFLRVYNYSSTAGGYDSVQQYIKNAYGSQANQYIEKLMDDLNGGARVDSTADFMNKLIALHKKASVFASASVVVQQPSAIARALAYINPKYFVTSAPSAMNLAKHKTLWEEVKKYAPVAVIKEMGYFDTGVGRSTVEWLKGNHTIKDKMDDVLSKAPAIADELVWTHIWEAVKKETAAKKGLKVGSEEFLKESGRRFTEVITNTQVYDSVLSRSGYMRSKDTGVKMATAFMAEPTTTVNMMVDGIIQGKRGNKKFTAATVGAVSVSIILNSILVALVYAARDDDEDETYTEKYLGSLTAELLDGFNPLTYLPWIKDAWSLLQGYDVERSDMVVLGDLIDTIDRMFSEDKSGWEKVLDATGAVSSLFGIPLKNIIRDARGMYNLTETITSGTQTTSGGVGDSIEDSFKSSIPLWDRIVDTDSKSDNLYDAIMSGDSVYIERLKKTYKTEDAYETAVRKALREHDSRIHEAAQARYDGDISAYTRIAKEIIAEGNFSQDTVVGAINAEISAIKKGESSESETTEDKDEVTSIYSGSDINAAFENGDTNVALEIIADLVQTKVANGKTEKEAKSSVRSSMTSYWKPLYKQAYQSGDSTEMLRIRRILLQSGLYGSPSDVVKTAKNWLKS